MEKTDCYSMLVNRNENHNYSMSRVILNKIEMLPEYVAIREIYCPLLWKCITLYRIASRYFRALTNAIRSSRLAEETDPSGLASLVGGEDAGGWGGWRSGERVAVLFSESPQYPEHNARYPSRLFRGYIVSVLRRSARVWKCSNHLKRICAGYHHRRVSSPTRKEHCTRISRRNFRRLPQFFGRNCVTVNYSRGIFETLFIFYRVFRILLFI